MPTSRVIFVLLLIFISLFILTCEKSTEPVSEQLSSFHVSIPSLVVAGVPFTVSVTAVGSEGTKPFASFKGSVSLSVTNGSVSPDSVSLTEGRGTADVIYSGGGGSPTLTATGGGSSGSAVLIAKLMTELPGAPTDAVEGAIPEFAFVPSAADYSEDHPDLTGLAVSHNTIMLNFELGTTVAECNAILSQIGASIAGGLKGVAGSSPGVLFVRLPMTGHAELEDTLANLRANPAVRTAVQDVLIGPTLITRPNNGNPVWFWASTPGDGNWGLERIRVPQMWNLHGAILKTGRRVVTGVIDAGFSDGHEDLHYRTLSAGVSHYHGSHVAGIIGADFDNGVGVDGMNPFADLVVFAPVLEGDVTNTYKDRMSVGRGMISGLADFIRSNRSVRVLNMSLGYNWYKWGIEPDNNAAAFNIANNQGRLLAEALVQLGREAPLPIICVAAGNESSSTLANDAKWSSPMTNAALAQGMQKIIVVENVMDSPGTGTGDVFRAVTSCVNGHISAPGENITSTSHYPFLYQKLSGTSMASPHVAALIGYLLCVDPALDIVDIYNLLMRNSLTAGGGAENRIDAWASVIDIDRLRGNDDVLHMMCDIDDGTPDGNQRLDYENGNAQYTEEDADGDGGVGDGEIDMSDFRRWRDWQLQIEDGPDLSLDGSDVHPKKDVNGDRKVALPEEEDVYPRGDFNGDGKLDRTATSDVPGAVNGAVTDLDVLRAVFDDPDYQASDLPGLVESADLTVDAEPLFREPEAHRAVITVTKAGTNDALHEREFTPGDPLQVVTFPVAAGDNQVATARLLDSVGKEIVSGENDLSLAIGGDEYWEAEVLAVKMILSQITPNAPGQVEVRAGDYQVGGGIGWKAGVNVALTVENGTASQPTGVTDAEGYFRTNISAQSGTVVVTAHAEDASGTNARKNVTGEVVNTGPPVWFESCPEAVSGDEDYYLHVCSNIPGEHFIRIKKQEITWDGSYLHNHDSIWTEEPCIDIYVNRGNTHCYGPSPCTWLFAVETQVDGSRVVCDTCYVQVEY